jgi:hypothetical protein
MDAKTPTLSSSSPQIHDRVLNFSLRVLGSREVTRVSFARDSDYSLQIRIDDETYSCRRPETTCVPVPELAPEISVTVMTTTYAGEVSLGSMLVVVNCGFELSMLQVSAVPLAGSARYWCWEITHDIQHQILDFIAAAMADR